MKITILGAGAMGSLFGGYLSKENEVWLVEINESRVEKINAAGIRVREQTGEDTLWHPRAVTDTRGLPQMDLIIVFVKAMYTLNALETNKGLIGPNTYLMTLQNGAGHEGKLLQYADRDHVVIGTTQHNSSVIENGYIHHGGRGKTLIGLLDGAGKELASIAENFSACGLECGVSDDVKRQIWNKLFTNTAASSLTAVLQVPLGFLWEDPHAHRLAAELCREAAAVANADCGGGFGL